MDVKILRLIAIMLVLTGNISSCAERDELGGDVPYKPCPCEKEMPLLETQHLSRGKAYLFRDSISKQMLYQMYSELSNATQVVSWIVFDSKKDSATLTIGGGPILNICVICNFPNFVKEWKIPQNGCKVYFEGVMYESCVPKGGIATISYFDYVLTNLKRK